MFEVFFDHGSQLWHDDAKTIPAAPGMTVAVAEVYRDGHKAMDLVQPDLARRPVCLMDIPTGKIGARFSTPDTSWNVRTIYAISTAAPMNYPNYDGWITDRYYLTAPTSGC